MMNLPNFAEKFDGKNNFVFGGFNLIAGFIYYD